jgi:ribonuclease-3
MNKDFTLLEKALGIEFENKDLLAQAFCHRSYLNENPDFKLGHNERLEFLGDAVLELIVTTYLFKNYPENPEGELTSWRAALVKGDSLSIIAEELGFNDFLLLSKGEKKEEGKARQNILADTMEAFIGALFLDQGFEVVKNLIESKLIIKLKEIIEKGLDRDAKSLFQEKAQEELGFTPYYKVLEESGPDHNKKFVVGVFLEDELVSEGEGLSKNEGEQVAAKKALEIKKW